MIGGREENIHLTLSSRKNNTESKKSETRSLSSNSNDDALKQALEKANSSKKNFVPPPGNIEFIENFSSDKVESQY